MEGELGLDRFVLFVVVFLWVVFLVKRRVSEAAWTRVGKRALDGGDVVETVVVVVVLVAAAATLAAF